MKRIAVVEDNPDNRLLVQVILEPQYEITEYDSGFAALEGLPKQMPDLVLLDISLPGMDGTEVVRRIRADGQLRSLPVIALTAHAMSGDREKFLAAGFDDYVTKPIVDESLLLGAIQKLLEGRPASATVPTKGAVASGVDAAALERLFQLGGPEFVAKMIGLFLSFTAEKIALARTSLAAGGNLDAVAKAAHPIRSSAGNIGADQLVEVARQLEAEAGQGKTDGLAALIGELEQGFAAIKPELEAKRLSLLAPSSPQAAG